MTRSVSFFAKIMLAVWLLATNHAVFELAGVMDHGVPSAVDAGQQPWHQVENTLTKQRTDLRTKPVAANHVVPLLDFVVEVGSKAVEFAAPATPAVDARTRAFHIWHFVQRAAPLPGAPFSAV